jgi:hypothetical protein
MHSHASRFISRVVGLGLGAFTVAAAIVFGPTASVTLNSFYALAVFGVAKIAVLSYSPEPRAYRRVAAPHSTPVETTAATTRPASSLGFRHAGSGHHDTSIRAAAAAVASR